MRTDHDVVVGVGRALDNRGNKSRDRGGTVEAAEPRWLDSRCLVCLSPRRGERLRP